jgi:site-specific recombinase XerD
MARKPRSAQTETRTNRLKLPVRRKPYFTAIAPGIRLGYRRNQGAGTWSVKGADGKGGSWVKVFAVADDYQDADGSTVLTYWQAIDKARAVAGGDNSAKSVAANSDPPLTVAEALANYSADLKRRNGDGLNVTRVQHHLPPALANKMVAELTTDDLSDWRDGLRNKGLADASADRSGRSLKAALNFAAKADHRITNRAAWRDGLAKLPDSEVARNAILSDDEVRRLAAAAYKIDPAFGLWIEVHAITGARTSQIERLVVADLQDNGATPRLMMPSSRKGRRKRPQPPKPIPISPSLAKALRRAAVDRARTAPLVVPPGGETLLRRWLKRAVKAAGLPAGTTLYALRHSSIVRQLLRGVPARIVASVHDTSIVMLERNYSAQISDHADALTRRALLDLGAPARGKVVPLRG